MKTYFKTDRSTYLFVAYGILTGAFLHFANSTGQDSFTSVQQSLSSPALVGLLILSAIPLLLIHNIFRGPFTHEKQNYYLENFCLFPIETGINTVKSLIGFILGVITSYAWSTPKLLTMYILWLFILSLFLLFGAAIIHYSKAPTIENLSISVKKFRAVSLLCLTLYIVAIGYEVIYKQILA
ncbi:MULTISPECIES: hypothetical protein [Stutzerimonas stutzeri subgroup]|uniref:hypothetical protein n=1 Tax=Stutzerimonas stutzeri subgroup TaxID=578833 RepID=UPI000F825E2A|nr:MULTISPECIES: hypothetical protein [Stutzerimonas stutzeri subgroup]MCQ2049113.1 hypothetical protein [Stutzerimonas kunmingensis]QQC11837.1 hypothetical protein I6I22_03215 [Stutzerimonas stutzeri]